MKRTSVFVAGTLVIAGLMASAAQAHRWGCWIQRDRNVAIRNASGGSAASSAISDWNSMTILNISSVSSGEEIYVFNANSGATGWAGLARITNYSGCNIIRSTAQLNTYYYSSTSTSARAVHCQEIGHGFGLDHSNDGGCMGAGYWYGPSNAYRPVSHNVNDIASMYANRSVDRHVDHGEEDPHILHGNWYHNPRTIREATRLSSNVVVATVIDVTDGPDIVNRTKDGYVSRIPTQRVSFDVQSSRKGDMVGGESFVLFQNGNEENRFDEDPSYEVGSRHLLFLTPRPDGTYLVLSPEGRYEITSKGLAPVTERSFAPSLKGASLQGILSDVTRALADPDEQ